MNNYTQIPTLSFSLTYWAKKHPHKSAILYGPEKLSYEGLNSLVDKFAGFMNENSEERHFEVLACCLPKCFELVISFVGCIRAGIIFAPLNLNVNDNALRYQFEQLLPRFVVVSKEQCSKVRDLIASIGLASYTKLIILGKNLNEEENDACSWNEMIRQVRPYKPLDLDINMPCYINYTSGTTGLPKGALATHKNIYVNAYSAIQMLDLKKSDVHFCAFPSYLHPHEIIARSIYLGGTIVLAAPTIDEIWSTIQTLGPTVMMANPSIYRLLYTYAERRGITSFGKLRIAESGGGPTDDDLVVGFSNLFKVSIIPVWGSTETTGAVIFNRSMPSISRPNYGFLGSPSPQYQVKVVNEAGTEVTFGEVGQMIISGDGVANQYYRLPEITESYFIDGWYYTQDLVVQTSEGFYFRGRKLDMIKIGGLKVYPLEVKLVIEQHPDVAECAVVGYSDPVRGENVVGYVVSKSNTLNVKDIVQFCTDKLELHKIPTRIIFLNEIPKSETGKVDIGLLKSLQEE